MFSGRNLRAFKYSVLSIAASTVLLAPAVRAQQQEIETPKIVQSSNDRGLALPSESMTLTIHLASNNEAAYDQAVEGLYTPGSPTYHHWFSAGDFAKYAPTPGEIETVSKELQSHGLTVISTDEDSVRVRGTVSSVEGAFNTQIHNYEKGGKTFYANAIPARISGPSAALVSSVSGLSNFKMSPMYKYQVNPKTGKPRPMISKSSGFNFNDYFTNDCFASPTSYSLTTAGATLPVGQYYGNVYVLNPLLECGWTPNQVTAHYGIKAGIKAGLDGTGQTIVLVEGPTDASVQADLVTFSKYTGLPAISTSNFKIIYPDGEPTAFELENIANWDVEADLDIEWAHAIAPGANLVLMIMPTEDWTEFEFGIQYAVKNKIANVLSNSYGYPEAAWGAYTLKGFDAVLKKAAAAGVAVNFSSGDGGDEGTGSPSGGGALYPASSSYSTSVGGTSIGLPNGNGGLADVGWGNNLAILSFATNYVLDPPEGLGLYGGSGGGESSFIAKPSWQKNLPGTGRQQPDISAIADPYTGAIIVSGGYFGVIGGTSLACPVFSGMWAIADQKAGASLGQAAPLIPTLASGAVKDIVPLASPTNVTGFVVDSSGSTFYSSDTLLAPLYTTTQYFSSVWDASGNGSGEYIDLSFGTDSSLTVTKGWDNVTGYGTPNGATFIDAAAAAK